jgi:hypothetical protein
MRRPMRQNTEKVTFPVPMDVRLKKLIEETAGDRPANSLICEIVARALKRPDLAKVPRLRRGRNLVPA